MRRLLLWTILLSLFCAIPADAASIRLSVSDDALLEAALTASGKVASVVEPGATLSFSASEGGSPVATALYLALKELPSGSISLDELSYDAEGTGLLVDDTHAFRFTNLAAGALHIAFARLDGGISCTVTLEDAQASSAVVEDALAPRRVEDYSLDCGNDAAILNNVALAAGSIYDTVLASGDVFSFNAIVGATLEQCGYVPAADGRGEVKVGGGVSIVASALWKLVQQRDDLVVVSKSTYGDDYNQSYVQNSSDAILVDYDSALDFSFRYIGDSSITIYATLSDTLLTIRADSVSRQ